ncbi:hypothetical protein CI793_13375 [Anoxybacillus ayderensis]|nr:hypothetical protein CI793_13375 [Anoxybacillus ayderensis]
MKMAVHVYECKGCKVLFAVSQDFEEQHLVQCPVCKTDEVLQDVSAGELHIQRKQQLLVVPVGQTNIFEFLG